MAGEFGKLKNLEWRINAYLDAFNWRTFLLSHIDWSQTKFAWQTPVLVDLRKRQKDVAI